jgi:transposase
MMHAGLAHLARTGFLKPVYVKSLPAHAVRALIITRKKLVGQRVTLENQIRGLAVVFGVRLPRALSSTFIRQALQASEGIPGLSAAMRGLVAARAAVLAAVVAIDGCQRAPKFPQKWAAKNPWLAGGIMVGDQP